MKAIKISVLCRVLVIIWTLGFGQPMCKGYAQPPTRAQQMRAYDFLQQYFSPISESYRLDNRLLPVVDPYDFHLDIRKMLSIKYLNDRQFATSVSVDTLLTAADIDFMQQQLQDWQQVRKWPAGALHQRSIAVLKRNCRHEDEKFAPSFTTYRVFPPLFSVDGQIAFFYVENYCGHNCAGGDVRLLRRQRDGKWKFVLGVPTFIS